MTPSSEGTQCIPLHWQGLDAAVTALACSSSKSRRTLPLAVTVVGEILRTRGGRGRQGSFRTAQHSRREALRDPHDVVQGDSFVWLTFCEVQHLLETLIEQELVPVELG